MFRFIHVSDTHLGVRPYGLIERERDFYDAFRWVIDKALELRVDAVLHAGDMFHSSSPRPVTYVNVIRELRRLVEAGIKFIVAPGNHELPKAEGIGSPIKLLEVLGYTRAPRDPVKPEVIEIGDTSIIVFSEWASELVSKINPLSMVRSEYVVGLAHIALCDALAEAEGIPLEMCVSSRRITSSMVRGGYSYLALGDIHTPWYNRVPGAPPIVYPGSTEYLDVGEYKRNSNRYVYLVKLDNGVVEAEKLRIEVVRPWIVIEGGYSDVVKSIESIKRKAGKEPIVYVKVKDPLEQAKRRSIMSRLESLRREGIVLSYNLVVKGDGDLKQVTYTPQPMSMESLLEKLVEKCGDNTRKEIVVLLSTLLNNPNDRTVLSNLTKTLEERGDVVECISRVFGEGVTG